MDKVQTPTIDDVMKELPPPIWPGPDPTQKEPLPVRSLGPEPLHKEEPDKATAETAKIPLPPPPAKKADDK